MILLLFQFVLVMFVDDLLSLSDFGIPFPIAIELFVSYIQSVVLHIVS